MNQSIEANSFEKSLLEKCTDGWQQESANELWKGSFSSVCSQNGAQNTNQVYENLLRICEEIDTALPEIRSTVNKREEFHINEQSNSFEDKPIEDGFDHNVAFEDIGTSLEDIEIYEDILNASAMMDNDDCIYNQNFDIMKTNQFLQSDAFNDFLTLPLPNSMQRAQIRNKNQPGSNTLSIFDRAPIFADDEIDQYLATKNFNFNEPFGTSANKSNNREDDSVDPLQFWHKLNCGKLPELCPSKSPTIAPVKPQDSDESKQSTKSVLAIFDFTLPSLSSSASSCALSSPEQKDIEIEPKGLETLPTSESNSNNGLKENSQSGLPVLIAGFDGDADAAKMHVKKKKKKKAKRNKNTLELLKHDLVLSSSSSSSESSLVSVSDIKPVKKRKLNTEPLTHQKPPSLDRSKRPDTKSSPKNTPKTKSTPQSTPKSTSPTLKAGAIYIEQQLSTVRSQTPHKKAQKFEPNRTPEKHPRQIAKEITPETSSKRKRKEKQDSNANNVSTPKSEKSKSQSSQSKKRPQRLSLPCPASMPQLVSESPPLILLTRIKNDENNKAKTSQGRAPGAKPIEVKNKSKNRR